MEKQIESEDGSKKLMNLKPPELARCLIFSLSFLSSLPLFFSLSFLSISSSFIAHIFGSTWTQLTRRYGYGQESVPRLVGWLL